MTQQQEVLRMVGKFLWFQAMGVPVSRDDCKAMADACFILLPMKYRLTKDEIAAMRQKSEQHLVS